MDYSQLSSLLGMPIWAFLIISLWSLVWKGLALWKSGRKNQPIWFIALLLINTLGILEILYLFIFSDMKDKNRKKKK